MRFSRALIGVFLFTLAGASLMAVADDATTQPVPDATTQPSPTEEIHGRHHKIPEPFNLLTDLTDDQKAQIAKIHKDTMEQEKELRDQERDSIMAVLTDDQRKELDDAEAKESLEKKANEEETRAREEEEKAQQMKQEAGDSGATTQP
jgi:Spy/CpxP family protein refolding chaperone